MLHFLIFDLVAMKIGINLLLRDHGHPVIFRVQVDGAIAYFTALGYRAWWWVGVIFGLIAKLDQLLSIT